MYTRTLAIALLALSGLVASGCDRAAGESDGTGADTQDNAVPLLLSPADLLVLETRALDSGPGITGSILPEKRADLRAEVSAVVLEVLKDNGDPVRRGDLLVRLDANSIRDTLAAAETAATTASQAFDQAQRQYERLAKLRADGLVSAQQVEDAEVRRNATQSDRETARSNLVAARQQVQRTMVRAPFDGVVSDRKVSAGDTAQIGKELLKVIDPDSLRFEGYVSADSIGEVSPGQPVHFRVHGYGDREFAGSITRVNPAANAATRQVEVLVAFADAQQAPDVAGLYAEGRVATRHAQGLSLPADAIVRDGDDAYAWRVVDGRLDKARLRLGDRDPRTGEFVLLGGLAAGDRIIKYPGSTLHEGQPATLAES